MTDTSNDLIDIVRKRMAVEAEADRKRHEAFEDAYDNVAINFFLQTEKTFIAHLQEQQFPGASILEMGGKPYLFYQLFDTSFGEGETHFQEKRAFYLLIDGQGAFSYARETTPSGGSVHLSKPKAEPVVLPTDLDGLKTFNTDNQFRSLDRHDYTALAAQMIFTQKKHTGSPVVIDGKQYGVERNAYAIERAINESILPPPAY